jgi:alanyl-tRNA synthetase
MTSAEIRQAFLDFCAKHEHAIIPSAPVVPENDPTTLFNVAGMQPLVPYLLGEPHPAGKRLADVQKCIRTVDIDEVGDDSHTTFMEMLGWWSLGDYFKEQTIAMSWEFFTEVLALPVEKLAVTVFEGDTNAERDEESAALWQEQGMPKERIFYRGAEDNWWGPAGQTGPCGPSTEIFYWVGDGAPSNDIDDERWLELGNNVLMHYEKTTDGKFEPIAQRNVDTGLGFERIVGVMQGASNVYETDLFTPITSEVKRLANKRLKDTIDTEPAQVSAVRIIADHLKAATFMIADGVRPSNVERGYILRRLIRRAIRQGRLLEIEYPFTEDIAAMVIEGFSEAYPELEREAAVVREELLKEENKFHKSLTKGLREVEGLLKNGEQLDGAKAFYFFETYGFPLELTTEELGKHGQEVDPKSFEKQFLTAQKAHQDKSRAGGEQKFAGGLADHSDEVVRQHTATHLLLAALRDVLGEGVKQRGSNITAERLRFDFSYGEKLTDEQRAQVEALVNQWIKEDLPVTRKEMPKADAERIGAQAEFGHKYPDVVSIYLIGQPGKEVSIEFCGGPHVEHTGQIGQFAIKKQESSGAGVRRIKAVVRD